MSFSQKRSEFRGEFCIEESRSRTGVGAVGLLLRAHTCAHWGYCCAISFRSERPTVCANLCVIRVRPFGAWYRGCLHADTPIFRFCGLLTFRRLTRLHLGSKFEALRNQFMTSLTLCAGSRVSCGCTCSARATLRLYMPPAR